MRRLSNCADIVFARWLQEKDRHFYVIREDHRNVCLTYAAANRADHIVLSCKTRIQGSNLNFF